MTGNQDPLLRLAVPRDDDVAHPDRGPGLRVPGVEGLKADLGLELGEVLGDQLLLPHTESNMAEHGRVVASPFARPGVRHRGFREFGIDEPPQVVEHTPGKVRQVYRKQWKAEVDGRVLEFSGEVVETDSATNPGDSGGPLLCSVGDRWTIFGITSFGEGCGKRGKYGIYTKVPNYVDWIQRVINVNGGI